MKKVTVYSMQNCPYCVKAKNLLTQRGVQYQVEMIDEWPDDQWDALVKKSGMKTVPQIYVDDQLIGGYNQLAEVDAKDQLSSLKG
jgi:glutaredoxin 3